MEISRLQQSHAEHFKNVLSAPLDRTLRLDLKNQADVKREWDNAKQDYEQKLKRLKKGGIETRNENLESESRALRRTAAEYFIKGFQVTKTSKSPTTERFLFFRQDMTHTIWVIIKLAYSKNVAWYIIWLVPSDSRV